MSKLIKFIKEVKAEFKNITWPKKDTLFQLTIVVISISIVISLILGGFDYLFVNSFKFLTQTRNSINQSQTTEDLPDINQTEIQEQPKQNELDIKKE
jgi:preprotein translocase subunit SecE